MKKENYKHLIVRPETHSLFTKIANKEGRDIMFLAHMLIKNYQINLNELRKK